MYVLGLHYIGCGCCRGTKGLNPSFGLVWPNDCCCFNCNQIDIRYRPSCPFARGNYYNY